VRIEPAVILLAAGLALGSARPAADAPSHRARMLNRWALEILQRTNSSVEERQRALRHIEEAIALEPDDAGNWLVLGRLREVAGEERLARTCFERAIALAPGAPEARVRLALVCKRTWLRTMDDDARDRAIAQLDTVTRLRPYGSEAWLRLVPLHYERGDLARAAEAAERALAGRPRIAEASLAAAYLACRLGDLERADSLFRAAIPRLAPDLRALLEDPSRILRAPPADDSAAAPSAPPPRPPLAALDPDPTTAANEVQLECWSRIAHAYLLLFDPLHPGLDARAETYIRYGPPQAVLLNPPGTPLYFSPANPMRTGRARTFTEFPLDAQRWDYPELGMRVLLHDRSLTGRYTEPVTRDFIPGTIPDARILARRPDLISLGGGSAVFPTLPPSSQRLEVRGAVLGFEGERGPHLLVQARASGTPGDTLIARWAVLDSAGREVARGAQSPAVSACDPAEFRLAEFTADLPAGRYDLSISVRDTHRRRGLYRAKLALAPVSGGLALSDLVLCCGDPSQLASEGSVRIEADVDATITGRRPLVAYFEIYRLAAGREGMSRFRYEYEVKRWADGPGPKALRAAERRPPVTTWASRDETHLGATRRQFMRVQTASLMPGRYRVRLRVRDLVSGAEAERVAEFVKE